MTVEFRSAQRSDAREIARLFQISSEGASDYIWSQLAEPGQDLLDVGAARYARDDVDFPGRTASSPRQTATSLA